MGESFQRRTGSIWRIAKRVRCSWRVTENQNLVRWIPESTSILSKTGACPMNVRYSCVRAEAHDPLDIGPVVPGAVEHHDLPGRGQVLDVALEVPLALFPVGRFAQRHGPGRAGIQVLGEALDRPALAGRVPALEHDDVLEVRGPGPSTGTSAARSAAGISPARSPPGTSARRRGSPPATSPQRSRPGSMSSGSSPCPPLTV